MANPELKKILMGLPFEQISAFVDSRILDMKAGKDSYLTPEEYQARLDNVEYEVKGKAFRQRKASKAKIRYSCSCAKWQAGELCVHVRYAREKR